MSATNDKTWNQWEGELDETFRKWWFMARNHEVITTWKRDAAGRRRAQRVSSLPEDRRVTLKFQWRDPASAEWRTLQITAEKRDRAVDNLAAIARAVEWLRMADVRELTNILTILMRQMIGQQHQQHQQHQSQQQRPPLSSTGPYAVLHITNDAPLAVAEAAYRAALRQAHPDLASGDHEQAKRLNAAIAAIRAERATEYANRR